MSGAFVPLYSQTKSTSSDPTHHPQRRVPKGKHEGHSRPSSDRDTYIYFIIYRSIMLHFEIKPTTMKVGKNKGSTLYYAKQRTHDSIRTSDLERRIERMTTLSRADIHAALIALSDVINEELRLGRSVSLAELGTFKLMASAKRMTKADEVTAQTIRTPRVRFYPVDAIRLAAKQVEITVDDAKGQPIKPKQPGGTAPGGGVGI